MKVKYYYKTGLFIALVISLLFFLPGYLEGRDALAKFLYSYGMSVGYIFLMWLLCAKLHQAKRDWYIIPVFRQYSKSINFIIISELIIGVIISIIFILITSYYNKLGGEMKSKMYSQQSFHGALNFNIFLLIIHSIILSVYLATSTTERQKKLLLEKEKLEKENIRAQFESLKQQVNPHFLFNSLNSLKAIANTHPEQVENYVIQLSSVYRYLLKHRSQDVVTLATELAFLKSYQYLLAIRFEDNFIIDIAIDEEYMQCNIPPLTLQLLIENAVKHNSISSDNILRIKVYTTSHSMLVVSNNIQKRQAVEGSSNFGLYNLNEQFRFLFSKEIVVDKTNDTFAVIIPLEKTLYRMHKV